MNTKRTALIVLREKVQSSKRKTKLSKACSCQLSDLKSTMMKQIHIQMTIAARSMKVRSHSMQMK